MRKFNNSILWITERIDVLKSQFDDKKKIQKCVCAGLIPDFDKFHFVTWYNDRSDIDSLNVLLNKSDKPVFLVANTASIIYKNRHELISRDKFGMMLIDESHWFGAQYRYDLASFVVNKWINIKVCPSR